MTEVALAPVVAVGYRRQKERDMPRMDGLLLWRSQRWARHDVGGTVSARAPVVVTPTLSTPSLSDRRASLEDETTIPAGKAGADQRTNLAILRPAPASAPLGARTLVRRFPRGSRPFHSMPALVTGIRTPSRRR